MQKLWTPLSEWSQSTLNHDFSQPLHPKISNFASLRQRICPQNGATQHIFTRSPTAPDPCAPSAPMANGSARNLPGTLPQRMDPASRKCCVVLMKVNVPAGHAWKSLLPCIDASHVPGIYMSSAPKVSRRCLETSDSWIFGASGGCN